MGNKIQGQTGNEIVTAPRILMRQHLQNNCYIYVKKLKYDTHQVKFEINQTINFLLIQLKCLLFVTKMLHNKAPNHQHY